MSVLFTDIITVYNHYVENRQDKWQRTVIKGVQWHTTIDNTMNATGQNVFSAITLVTIPLKSNFSGRRYISPTEFRNSVNRVNKWTLDPSNGNDVIVYGECLAEISDLFPIDILLSTEQAITIKAVSDNTLRPMLKTWKVQGE